jgi:hypothetical protein
MTTNSPRLPVAFADLEPFVPLWAIATMGARHRRRITSSAEERQAFYDAMTPRLAAVTTYLNAQPLQSMPADAKILMQLALSLMEVALTLEVYDAKAEAIHARSSKHARIGREMDGL